MQLLTTNKNWIGKQCFIECRQITYSSSSSSSVSTFAAFLVALGFFAGFWTLFEAGFCNKRQALED